MVFATESNIFANSGTRRESGASGVHRMPAKIRIYPCLGVWGWMAKNGGVEAINSTIQPIAN